MSLHTALESLGDQFESNFRVRIKAIGEDENTQALWQKGLPETLPLAMYRVTEEAMNNVLKHSGASEVEVTLQRHSPDAVTLTVRDDGGGFDIGQTESGLGIMTMQDYCGSEGGTLSVSSDLGKGTTVRAVFPLSAIATPGARRAFETPVRARLTGASPAASTAERDGVTKLVVVDDQSDFCGLLRDMLQPYDDFVVVAEGHDGAAALRLVEGYMPDVVLLDVELPDTHGVEVAREIRAKHPGVKVVLMSAYYKKGFSKQEGFEYIPKVEFSVSRLREISGSNSPNIS